MASFPNSWSHTTFNLNFSFPTTFHKGNTIGCQVQILHSSSAGFCATQLHRLIFFFFLFSFQTFKHFKLHDISEQKFSKSHDGEHPEHLPHPWCHHSDHLGAGMRTNKRQTCFCSCVLCYKKNRAQGSACTRRKNKTVWLILEFRTFKKVITNFDS